MSIAMSESETAPPRLEGAVLQPWKAGGLWYNVTAEGDCWMAANGRPWIKVGRRFESTVRLAAQLAEARELLDELRDDICERYAGSIMPLAAPVGDCKCSPCRIARLLGVADATAIAGSTADAPAADIVRVLVLHHPAVGPYSLPEPPDEAGTNEVVRRYAAYARSIGAEGEFAIHRFYAPSWEAWCRVMPPLEISAQSMPLLRAMRPDIDDETADAGEQR